MPLRARMAVAACVVALMGCGAPPAVLLPAPSPPSEALAFFPEGALGVALVGTDPDDPGVGRLLAALPSLAPDVAAGLPDLEQARPLLGNDLALGVVAPGEAPLAVLVARDGSTLHALAEARANVGMAAPAGRYLGADLYTADGHAYAVRHDVLLVSATTADLRAALKRRATVEGMEARDFPRADAHVRATVALQPLIARAGERWRAVPWLAAAERATVTVDAEAAAAVAKLAVDTSAGDLLDRDVPVTADGRGPAMADVVERRLAVRDAAHVLGVAERAAALAAPLELLRAAPALPAARALASALHGPATVVHRRGHVLVRAVPSHPARVDRALARLVRALPRAGFTVETRRGADGAFHEVRGVRFGVSDGVLVAGTASARRLRDLARARVARPAGSRGSLAFASPAERLTGWASATPDELAVELRVGWP